jgi:hypothetical protein
MSFAQISDGCNQSHRQLKMLKVTKKSEKRCWMMDLGCCFAKKNASKQV